MKSVKAIAIFSGLFVCVGSILGAEAQSTKSGGAGFSAQGRIEGAGPTVKMAFTVPGTVKEVLVKPGERVLKGAVLMSLICDDRTANVTAAEASMADARAQLAKLKKGARAEERQVATAQVGQAQSDVGATRNVYTRLEKLRAKGGVGGNIAEIQFDAASDAMRAAQAKLETANAQAALVNAPARKYDILVAEANVASSVAKVASAKAEVEKCHLRAPRDMTLLKTFLERGDAISITPLQTALTVADVSKLRVRAELDERFVERIKVGHVVSVVSDFNSALRMAGKVVSREAQMGRRTILGTDPADKNDRDVLEVLVEIDKKDEASAANLPVGYRVIVQF